MGNTLSSCCGGSLLTFGAQRISLNSEIGRQKDGLYEPALAESEREAVAELLTYLENVCAHDHTTRQATYILPAGRDRFLLRRSSASLEYSSLLRQRRPSAKC